MERRGARPPLILALCAGYFLVLLDVTIVSVALPSIGAELTTSSTGLAWVVDGYAVPLAALLLSSGAIGDRLGHRRVVLSGFLGFGLASAVCASATSAQMLVAGRAAQGVAAALTLPGTLALLAQSAPDERARTRLVGLWAAVGGAALPAGPVLGGVLTQFLGWQAVFWINLPVIAAAVLTVARQTRPDPRTASTAGVDWPGAAALVVLTGSTVTAIIETRHSVAVAAVGVCLALCSAVAFGLIERRTTTPLLRVPVPMRRLLIQACSVAGLMNLCAVGTLFVLTQIFQTVHGLTPLTAGLLLLPAMLPLPLLGHPSGRLSNRIGPWRTAALGLAISAAGFVAVALALERPAAPGLLVGLFTWGTGIGVLTPAIVTAALRTTPAAPGTASGASNAARQTGGAIGVALFSALTGAATHAGYETHVRQVLLGCAVAFALAAVLIRRPGATREADR